MGLLEVFSWLYISYVCDVIVRSIVGAFKKNRNKAIEQSDDSCKELLDEELKQAGVKGDNEVKQPSKTEEDSTNLKKCPFLSRITEAFFGRSTDLSKLHSDERERPEWRGDPLIKEGLARVDKVSEDGKTKVTSYYDQNGKLLYQQERDTLPRSKNLLDEDKFKDPKFFLKPQPQPMKDFGYKPPIEETIDKKFREMFSSMTELPKDAKRDIDNDIDQTFNELITDFTLC